MRIEFEVIGKPQQVGSKISLVPLDKDGNPYRRKKKGGGKGRGVVVSTKDSNPKAEPWMAAVRAVAYRTMLESGYGIVNVGPVRLSCVFYFARPKGHYGTGRNAGSVKGSSPVDHVQTPDLCKLIRAVEDAMSGVVYRDDSQVNRHGESRKEWTSGTERVVVVVEIPDIPPAQRAQEETKVLAEDIRGIQALF